MKLPRLSQKRKLPKMILIQNQVRNLLDSARRLQCHTFHSWKYVKPALYKCTQQQPVSRHNRLLSKRRHFSMSGPNPQSRASSSRPRITKEDEAVLDNHDSALEDQCYKDTFSTVKELDIAKSPRTTQSS